MPRAFVATALPLLLVAWMSSSGAALKVTYVSGPHGIGPDNNPEYVKGRTCGVRAADVAWDKQLGPYNDSQYNPDLKPVTEFRTRTQASLQTAWGSTEGEEHGFRNTIAKSQETFALKANEVITKVQFLSRSDGAITNLTLTTNLSRTWVPTWIARFPGSQTIVAAPPAADEWSGPPVVGDWYLAYTAADLIGYCIPQNTSDPLADNYDGPIYYFTPILYFVFAADAVEASPVLPSPPPVSPPPPPGPSPLPSPSPKPKPKSKPSIGIIAGATAGAVFLIVVAALVWVCCHHGKANLVQNPIKNIFGGQAAPVVAPPGPGGGGGSGGDEEKGVAPAGMQATGTTHQGLPTSPPVAPATVYGTPYHPHYPATVDPPATQNTLAPEPSYPSTIASPRGSVTARPGSVSEQPALGAGGLSSATAPSSRPGSANVVVPSTRRATVTMAPGGIASPGMMGGTGGGGAITVGPMAAVGAAGVAVMGTVMLAKEILDAGDRVVANHARCLRLTSRIHSILPLLNWLAVHLEKEAAAKGEQSVAEIQNLIVQLNTVFGDVKDCISRWCGTEASSRNSVLVKVLRNMMVSRKFEDEFLDLNERLSQCYQDLILALNIKRTITDIDPTRMRQQHEEDVAADLKGVAEELSTAEGEEAWSQLPADERVTIRETFNNYGLNFNAMMTQARKNAVGERVKDLIIPWSDIHVTAEVGSGGYGTVYRGTWQDIDVAVKKLHLTVVTERAKRELSHEAYVMSLLRHPNVATSYGMVLQPPHCALLMKFYGRGTLLELLHDDSQPLTLRRKLQLASDVAKGMAYLHNRPSEAVIHGDLKPSNLLIDDDGKVVITDFGLSRVSTLTLTTRPSSSAMSVTYTAPEILADPTSKRSTAADVYAYGLVLFEIFTRELPFESAADVMAVVRYVLGGGRPKVAGAEFDQLRVPKEIVELMQQCWQHVADARPTFTAIVERLKDIAAANDAA